MGLLNRRSHSNEIEKNLSSEKTSISYHHMSVFRVKKKRQQNYQTEQEYNIRKKQSKSFEDNKSIGHKP